MKKKIQLLVIALMAGVFMSFGQSVDEIINKHVAAMGGNEKLADLKTIRMSANVEVGPNMKAPMTMSFINNKSFRMDISMQGMTMTTAIEGDSGWMVMPFGGKKDPERMDKEAIESSRDMMDVNGSLYNYKAKGSTVELIGKEDMEGTDTYKLKVTKKNGDIEYEYLDATSYLRLKTTTKHKFKDKETSGDALFSNYKKVEGIMFAYTIENRETGGSQGQIITFDNIEVNPKFDKDLFKMPVATATESKPAEKK
ncbi:MAG: hypothetical protein WCL14_05350 [Bacteroidota bacterium]